MKTARRLLAVLCVVAAVLLWNLRAEEPLKPALRHPADCLPELAGRLHSAAVIHMSPTIKEEQIAERWRKDPVIRNLYRAIAQEAAKQFSEGGICK